MQPYAIADTEKLIKKALENARLSISRIHDEMEHIPPVDLRVFSRYCKVNRLIQEPLTESAMLVTNEHGLTVVVNKDHSEERKRFSWAHELGHIFLGQPLQHGTKYRGRSVSFDSVERACDQLAAEILMPSSQFHRMVADLEGLKGLPKVAREFRVSLTSAAIRYSDLVKQPSILMLWEYLPDSDSANLLWQRPNEKAKGWMVLSNRLPAQLSFDLTRARTLTGPVKSTGELRLLYRKKSSTFATCITESLAFGALRSRKCFSIAHFPESTAISVQNARLKKLTRNGQTNSNRI